MKKISLTQGKFALVFAYRDKNTFYAARWIRIDGKRYAEKMHRRILKLKPGDGKKTDHKNHDGVDNRNKNIRICTNRENAQNQIVKRSNNTSGFKGVSWDKQHKKWRAYIRINSRRKYLGLFKSKVKAAQAYNDAAIKYFREFANLNQIKIRDKR
jgi:hypothetical protein